MRDTNAEVVELQIEAFRRMSPEERVARAFEASDWLLAIGRARTDGRSPSSSKEETEAPR